MLFVNRFLWLFIKLLRYILVLLWSFLACFFSFFLHQYRIPGLFLSFFIFFFNIEYQIYLLSCADGGEWGLQARSPARLCFSCLFLFFHQYRIPILIFVLRGRRTEGVADANPLFAWFLFIFSFFFFNIEYLFWSFVLRGRRTEGVAGANPLCELPRFT